MTDRPSYRTRLAEVFDLAALGPLELRAAERFRESSHAYACGLPPFDGVALAHQQRAGKVWVAVNESEQPIGFAIAGRLSDEPYLCELDVEPAYGGQGIGRSLLRAVAAGARADGAASLLLSTFADIPWNGPFYARLGFEVVPLTAYTEAMHALRRNEGAQGMLLESRVIMRARLSRLLDDA